MTLHKYQYMVPYSSKVLWSNLFVIFVNYTEITKFCQEHFLTPPLSTGLHTSKSRNNDESRKSAKITKIFNHKNLELYGVYI